MMVYAAGIVLIMIFMPSGIAGRRVDHYHTRFGPEGSEEEEHRGNHGGPPHPLGSDRL